MSPDAPVLRQLETTFGPLEIRVLDALWARDVPSCVKDLLPDFPGVAYTTLMTTLDRLFPGDQLSARPILSLFVDTVSERDEALLEELEELVRKRRSELKGRDER